MSGDTELRQQQWLDFSANYNASYEQVSTISPQQRLQVKEVLNTMEFFILSKDWKIEIPHLGLWKTSLLGGF